MKIDNILVNKIVPIPNASFKADKSDCINVYLPTQFDPFGNPVNKGTEFQAIDYVIPINKVEYRSVLYSGNFITINMKVRSLARISVILSFESANYSTGTILQDNQYLYVNGVLKPSIATGCNKQVPGKLTTSASWSISPVASDVGKVWSIMYKNMAGTMNHAVMELRC
jgi:hypothetical protein